METLERAARRIGIEGPGRRLIGAEMSIKMRATVVLPTPPLSPPTRMTAGLAMACSEIRDAVEIEPKF
jgi:hypothetical protein